MAFNKSDSLYTRHNDAYTRHNDAHVQNSSHTIDTTTTISSLLKISTSSNTTRYLVSTTSQAKKAHIHVTAAQLTRCRSNRVHTTRHSATR